MFDAILSKFEKPLSMVIAIDDYEKQIHFYSISEEDKSTIKHDIEIYRSNLFTDDFYEKFNEIIKLYQEKIIMQVYFLHFFILFEKKFSYSDIIKTI